MRLLLTILALLALPGAALAQGIPLRAPAMPPNQANSGFHGITVNGSATKSIPATRARVTLMVFSRTPSINAKTIQPVVDALIKAGIPIDHIALPPDLGSVANVNNATIVVTVDNPTVELMQNGIAMVGAAIAGTDGIGLGNAQVALEADDCAATIDAVRAEAIKVAHTKAVQTAKDLQVSLGAALNVLANDQLSPTGTCSSQYFIGGGNNSNLVTAKDYVSVPVTDYVTITYGIK